MEINMAEERICSTCKYEDLSITSEQCRNCHYSNRWEAKEKKCCGNCKYEDLPVTDQICRGCYGAGNWRPKAAEDYKRKINAAEESLKQMCETWRKSNMPTGREGTITGRMFFDEMHLLYPEKIRKPIIKDVIFNNPATIVFWEDGTKTVVKCQGKEKFDPEKGLSMAIVKKVYGNNHDYYIPVKKWVGRYEKQQKKKRNGR